MTARPNSMGRSLTRYMSAALSFAIIDLSIGNVKIAVNNGKYPQNTPMKNNNPDYICSIHYFITASSRHSIAFKIQTVKVIQHLQLLLITNCGTLFVIVTNSCVCVCVCVRACVCISLPFTPECTPLHKRSIKQMEQVQI